MSKTKSHRIALLVESSTAYGRGILSGATRYAHNCSRWTIFRDNWFLKTLKGDINTKTNINKYMADGAILYDILKEEDLLKLAMPTIVINCFNNPPKKIPCIVTDNKAIGELGAQYFLHRGFKHFGYCGFNNHFWSKERGDSFSGIIKQMGHSISVYQPSKSKDASDNEILSIGNWLHTLPLPVAVLACNDDRGEHVIEACGEIGLNVPKQVAVLGVDNDEVFCEMPKPSLSSISINTQKAGYEAAKLLDMLMAGEPMKGQSIIAKATYVQTRQSTDILAVKDHEVAKAVAFIQEHKNRIVQVSEVVSATFLSRRILENRFLAEIGHPIHKEIMRIRLEEVANMLTKTYMTLSQIALTLGYPDLKHISRLFKKEMGLTAMQYRELYGMVF